MKYFSKLLPPVILNLVWIIFRLLIVTRVLQGSFCTPNACGFGVETPVVSFIYLAVQFISICWLISVLVFIVKDKKSPDKISFKKFIFIEVMFLSVCGAAALLLRFFI